MENKRACNEKIYDKKKGRSGKSVSRDKMEKCMTRENLRRENARRRTHLRAQMGKERRKVHNARFAETIRVEEKNM